MITRRNFLRSAAVSTVATPLATEGNAVNTSKDAAARRPLKAEPQRRLIHAKPASRGSLRLYSDGSPEPRPLIRKEVLEQAFGQGVGQSLLQPDHWRMIDEGWFEGEDLYELTDLASWDFAVWKANYHPECEAHDLLYDFFSSGLLPGGGIVEDVGLAFAEHPCTPRFATVTVLDADRLPELAARVAELTEWVSIQFDRAEF